MATASTVALVRRAPAAGGGVVPARRARVLPVPPRRAYLNGEDQPAAAGGGEDAAAKARVRFQLPKHVEFGEELCVVGEADELGAWDVSRCVSMAWNEGDVWVAEAELPSGGAIEYKYVVRPSGGKKALAWQPCNNLALKLDESAPLPELTVRDAWEGSLHELLPGMASLPEPPKAAVPEPAAAAAEHDGGASVVDKDGAADAAVDVSAAAATPVTTMGEEAAPLAAPLAEDAPPAVASAARAAPAANSNGRRRRTTSAVLTAAEDDAAAAAPVPKQKPVMRQNVLPDWLTGKKNTPQASAATSSDLGSLSMSELRDRCKARGLSVKGQRKELLARLSEEDTSA